MLPATSVAKRKYFLKPMCPSLIGWTLVIALREYLETGSVAIAPIIMPKIAPGTPKPSLTMVTPTTSTTDVSTILLRPRDRNFWAPLRNAKYMATTKWAQRKTPRNMTGVTVGIFSKALICLLKTQSAANTISPAMNAALVAYRRSMATLPVWPLARNSETNLIITKPTCVKAVDITKTMENSTSNAEYSAGEKVFLMKRLNRYVKRAATVLLPSRIALCLNIRLLPN